MINAIEETQKRGVNRAEHRRICAANCRITPRCRCLKNWCARTGDAGVADGSLAGPAPVRNREKYREYYQGKYSLTDAQSSSTKRNSWRLPHAGHSRIAIHRRPVPRATHCARQP